MKEQDTYAIYEARRFVRYPTGAELYDMSQSSFEYLAKNAGAVCKVGKIALVDRRIIDAFLESCRIAE